MEFKKWEKDQTPYLIFACNKCQQFSYVKTTQKTKKCLRCGRTHQVKYILSKGQIIYGMTAAVNKVKDFQNRLGKAQFAAENEFIVYSNSQAKHQKNDMSLKKNNPYQEKFQILLRELSSKYKEFPTYMIEILAKNYNIPRIELDLLLKKFIKKKLIAPSETKKAYYKYFGMK